MRSARLDALGARLDELDHVGLAERALRARDASAHEVAGNGAADEHDVAVAAGHAGAAMGEPVDAQLQLVALAGPGCRCRGAFHDALWSQPYFSFDSIALSTPLRLALRRS